MAQKIYGIDFGTDTIKIYKKGQGIILIEKNVVSTVGKREDLSQSVRKHMKCLKRFRRA